MTNTHTPTGTPAYTGEFRMGEVPPEDRPMVEAAMAQAREDAFNIMRDALKTTDQNDRWEFLQYCLNGWVESGATGFLIVEYDAGISKFDIDTIRGMDRTKAKERRPAKVLAIEIGDDYLDDAAIEKALNEGDPEHPVFTVTHDTIEIGLQRIRQAVDIPDGGMGNWERNLTSVKFLGQGLRGLIIEADLTNEAASLDVYGYSAIVEIALLNEVRYC